MSSDWQQPQLQAWLDAQIDLPVDRRAQALADFCRLHPELAATATTLDAALSGNSPLDHALWQRAEPEATQDASTLPAGTRLGPWRVVRWVAAGGMADVYLGERADAAFERKVALKLLRDVRTGTLTRFVREQSLLARLQHPAIAALIDAGQDDQGRAWLAMPWVDGEDLSQWLLGAHSLQARLAVIGTLCDAVAFAHQQLVIHRDLKPRNVRIRADGSAVLLDFGIAALLEDESAAGNTQLFTPEYASPEQLRGEPCSVLTDVHGLGLLLFEVLTGRPAFTGANASLAAVVHAICNTEAPLAHATAPRHGAFEARQLHRDLSAICAKALAKRPTDRYPSVLALKEDLLRYQRCEPINARSSGLRRHVALFLQRHPLSSALAAALAISVAVGVSMVLRQSALARVERDRAVAELQRTEALREHWMLVLRQGVGDGTGLRAALDASVAALDERYADQPAQRAQLLLGLGELYFAAGDYVAARAVLERLLPLGAMLDPDLHVQGLNTLALSVLRQGEIDVARKYLQTMRTVLREVPPTRSAHAQRLLLESAIARANGELEAALPLQIEGTGRLARASDATALDLGIAQSNLAATQMQLGLFDAARQTSALSIATFAAGGMASNSNALTVRSNAAQIEVIQGRPERALAMLQPVEAEFRARGTASAPFAALLNAKARALLALHRIDPARASIDEALQMASTTSGPGSSDRTAFLLTAVEIDISGGAANAARREALRSVVDALPGAHPFRARWHALQGLEHEQAQRFQAAATAFEQASDQLKSAPAGLRATTPRLELLAARQWLRVGDPARARAALERVQLLLVGVQDADGLDMQEHAILAALLDRRDDPPLLMALEERLGATHPRILALHELRRRFLTGMKKHVGALELAGLMMTGKVGRVRTCRIGPCRLEEVGARGRRHAAVRRARTAREG